VSTAAPFEYPVSCIGVSHHGAALELLERLSIPSEALPRALAHFPARGPGGERLSEGVPTGRAVSSEELPVERAEAGNGHAEVLSEALRELFHI
jgi:hypothetical protein